MSQSYLDCFLNITLPCLLNVWNIDLPITTQPPLGKITHRNGRGTGGMMGCNIWAPIIRFNLTLHINIQWCYTIVPDSVWLTAAQDYKASSVFMSFGWIQENSANLSIGRLQKWLVSGLLRLNRWRFCCSIHFLAHSAAEKEQAVYASFSGSTWRNGQWIITAL